MPASMHARPQDPAPGVQSNTTFAPKSVSKVVQNSGVFLSCQQSGYAGVAALLFNFGNCGGVSEDLLLVRKAHHLHPRPRHGSDAGVRSVVCRRLSCVAARIVARLGRQMIPCHGHAEQRHFTIIARETTLARARAIAALPPRVYDPQLRWMPCLLRIHQVFHQAPPRFRAPIQHADDVPRTCLGKCELQERLRTLVDRRHAVPWGLATLRVQVCAEQEHAVRFFLLRRKVYNVLHFS